MMINSRPKIIFLFFLFFLFLSSVFCFAQNTPQRPFGYVTDTSRLLSSEQIRRIEALISELEKKTTAQVAVVAVPSTSPDTIEQYTVNLFQQWGIGEKGKDNGVLFLIAVNDRNVRIEVGYGLEGSLTDAMSRSIIEKYIIPSFRQGMFAQGIENGVSAIVSVVAKSYDVSITGREQQVHDSLSDMERQSPGIISIIFFIIMIILFIKNPRLFFYMFLFSSMGGGRGGSWSGGGGGFGGGSGGFGGGRSGGGGASGRW